MSKINKIRFVNLNYNNNTMKIDDEIFFLDSENTMLNLRNGGGKSVIVQMVMAPFVNRRYRAIKDRAFESYFTSQTPTYILVEWKLDDGAGYLLTGMMVRKKESVSDENSKEKLDIINITYEYKDRNEYDIDNIPVIELKGENKFVKSFSNSKKLFEELKKDKNLKFNYYDMNNPVTAKNYFTKLQEFKINYKEWETIIKQINLKESGLSELFTKAKNTSGLVKDWFLPAIENKLTKEEDKIKNYADLVNKYINQYKDNKSKINRKEKIELFNELSKELFELNEEFTTAIINRKDIENKIANIREFLKKSYNNNLYKEEELSILINELKLEVIDLNYEKESLEIYKKEKEINDLEVALKNYDILIDEKAKKINNTTKSINILECAKIHKDYKEKSEELQRLETERSIVANKNKNTLPKINDLGFNIREILKTNLKQLNLELIEKVEARLKMNKDKKEKEKIVNENRELLNILSMDKGSVKSKKQAFNKIENNFNSKFNENITRNITGVYSEEDLIDFEKDILDNNFILEKERKNFKEEAILIKENIKSNESKRIKNIEEKSKIKNSLENKNNELMKLEEEIKSHKEIIKYIDFTEDKVFNRDSILLEFNKKIDLLKKEELNLVRECDILDKEIEKLKSGKVLELSKEVEEKLKEKDISIIYGMEWLKQNGYSEERNSEIVNKNPFIPYSLIMNTKDIENLQREPLDIFTSVPISIINRTDLEKSIETIDNEIVKLNSINFFISFNNKLLNEEELLKLIIIKEKYLTDYTSILNNKRESITLYENKRGIIIHSSLNEKDYNNVKKDIEALKDKFESLRQMELDIEKEISDFKSKVENLDKNILETKDKININTSKLFSFKELCSEYREYLKNKEELENIIKEIENINNILVKDEEYIKNIYNTIEVIAESIRKYEGDIEILENKLSRFKIYNEGVIIKRDIEDLLAEYEALSKEITDTEKQLNDKISYLNIKFNEVTKELNIKADKYNLSESEYTNVRYSLEKNSELEEILKNEIKEDEVIKNNKHNTEKKIERIKGLLEALYKKIKKDFNKDDPKDKEILFDKNFEEEIAKVKSDIKEKDNLKNEVSKESIEIKQNLISLSEFDNLEITKSYEVKIDINSLKTEIGKTKRDLTIAKDNEVKYSVNIKNTIMEIEAKDVFRKDQLFKKPLNTLKMSSDNPLEFKKQLNIFIGSYKRLLEKLLTDINLIKKEGDKILDSILEYIEEVHKNIGKIDDNSSININGKRVKMLNISNDNFEENKEVYKIKLKDYIEAIREISLKELNKNNDIEDIISNSINTFKLYDEVVGISNINIKLYKIEENKQKLIHWDEVAKNSGGEGFLSAFVILSSLLSYMRKDESDLFSRRESGKVLIMDNPFAQTNAAHLLKPLMDIAKKSNTQLICLTGLGGDSIYNSFDNIYVLDLISSKLKNGIKYLKSNHLKGYEKTETLVLSRFKVEEQTRLF